jgi:hypothetical protein
MLSYKNWIWVGVIGLVAVLALWFVVRAGCEVYRYLQLDKVVEVSVESWSVEERGSNQYAVMATYTYDLGGKNYSGKEQVGGKYPNPWAAGEAKNRFATQKWSAWVNPHHPEKSVLEKHFPVKKTVSALVLLGLALYFLLLGLYMRVKHG